MSERDDRGTRLRWRTSSYTSTGNCVEVAGAGSIVLVRNSNRRADGSLTVPSAAFGAWVDAVKAGALDDLR